MKKNYFTIQQLLTIFRLQGEANDMMSEAWRYSSNGDPTKGGISYYRAAHIEASEAIGHLGFKWWKKEVPNYEQAKLELIDMLHFSASDDYREFYHYAKDNGLNSDDESNLIYYINRNELNKYYEEIEKLEDKELLIQAVEFELASISKSGQVTTSQVIELLIHFGVPANEAYNLYVGKNTLNKFRTANGQKQNTYFKAWYGKEDNDSLFDYLRNQTEAVDINNLWNWLTTTYQDAKSVAGIN